MRDQNRVFKNILINEDSLRVHIELTEPLKDRGMATIKTALGDKKANVEVRIIGKTPRRKKPALYEFSFEPASDKAEDVFVATICGKYDFVEAKRDVEQLNIFIDKKEEG